MLDMCCKEIIPAAVWKIQECTWGTGGSVRENLSGFCPRWEVRLLNKGVHEVVGEADGWQGYLGGRTDRNEEDSGGRQARGEQLYQECCMTKEHVAGHDLQVPFWICRAGGQLNMVRAPQRSWG